MVSLSKNIIKMIAMFTMTLNHVVIIFMSQDTWEYYLLSGIGYFTGVVMIQFLLEGYRQTRSRKKYFIRLLCFGLISQLPYSMAFPKNGGRLNMLFTLLLCLGIIFFLEKKDTIVIKNLFIIGAFFASLWCDWPVLAPLLTLLIYWSEKSDKKRIIAHFTFACACLIMFFMDYRESFSILTSIFYSSLNIIGIVVAFLILSYFYDNEYDNNNHNSKLKWFFYIFYPVHLIIIGIIERI